MRGSCVDYVWLSLRARKILKNASTERAYSAQLTCSWRMSSEHITYMGRSKCFLTYSCLALEMRNVFANFVALLTRNAVAKRCVFADLYTCFIYNRLYNGLKLAGSSHILTKFMDAQRRTALIFVTQGVGCASCMCDWGIIFSLCSILSTFELLNSSYYSLNKWYTILYRHKPLKKLSPRFMVSAFVEIYQ